MLWVGYFLVFGFAVFMRLEWVWLILVVLLFCRFGVLGCFGFVFGVLLYFGG